MAIPWQRRKSFWRMGRLLGSRSLQKRVLMMGLLMIVAVIIQMGAKVSGNQSRSDRKLKNENDTSLSACLRSKQCHLAALTKQNGWTALVCQQKKCWPLSTKSDHNQNNHNQNQNKPDLGNLQLRSDDGRISLTLSALGKPLTCQVDWHGSTCDE